MANLDKIEYEKNLDKLLNKTKSTLYDNTKEMNKNFSQIDSNNLNVPINRTKTNEYSNNQYSLNINANQNYIDFNNPPAKNYNLVNNNYNNDNYKKFSEFPHTENVPLLSENKAKDDNPSSIPPVNYKYNISDDNTNYWESIFRNPCFLILAAISVIMYGFIAYALIAYG